MLIEGKRVFLRFWKNTDIPRLLEICSDKSISRFTTVPFPYTKKHAKKFIEKAARRRAKGTELDFAIVLKEKKLVIGSVSLMHINKLNKSAKIGYWLAKEFRGKGIVPEAAELLLDFGFNKLKLHRIVLDCATKNKASKKVIEKLGCKFEGKQRNARHLHGKYFDILSYAILETEFRKKIKLKRKKKQCC